MAHLVVVNDHALELHAHLHDGREVLDAVERNLGDVQQPRHATDLHERSVGLDGLDVTVTGAKKKTSKGIISNCGGKTRKSQIFDSSTVRSCHRRTYIAVVDNEKKHCNAIIHSDSTRRVGLYILGNDTFSAVRRNSSHIITCESTPQHMAIASRRRAQNTDTTTFFKTFMSKTKPHLTTTVVCPINYTRNGIYLR